jgi:hypothetical protein
MHEVWWLLLLSDMHPFAGASENFRHDTSDCLTGATGGGCLISRLVTHENGFPFGLLQQPSLLHCRSRGEPCTLIKAEEIARRHPGATVLDGMRHDDAHLKELSKAFPFFPF